MGPIPRALLGYPLRPTENLDSKICSADFTPLELFPDLCKLVNTNYLHTYLRIYQNLTKFEFSLAKYQSEN